MQFDKTTLEIARVGALELDIPVLEMGCGDPRVLIVSGLHGDETGSMFAVDRLVDDLDRIEGRLDVIPSAHPMAQLFTQRTSPFDDVDLNRNFQESGPRRGLSDQTADALMERFRSYDFVLDLHTLTNRSPAVCIFVDGGPEPLRHRSRRAIRQFAPDIVWHVDLDLHGSEGRALGDEGRLGPWLLEHEIPNIVVEMPQNYHRDEARLQRVVEGLKCILADWEMIERDEVDAEGDGESIPMFQRYKQTAGRSGLFEPAVELGDRVEAGQAVGRLTDTTTLDSMPVRADRTGRVIMLSPRDFAMPGDPLLSIGDRTGAI